MKRRLLVAPLLGLALVLLGTSAAFAHGENAQESWLRMNTVAFWNVGFSTTTVKQGEQLVVTGTAKVLETWPKTLKNPDVAFISVVSPGPVFILKDRQVNGLEAPDAFYIEKGGIYDFKLTLVGRHPGRYHVHPTFAVKGAGTLIGPGEWITVQKNPAGFSNKLTLYNGKTVNLENYGLAWPVTGFTVLTFLIGLAWLLYWIVPKPTVSRLAITSQLSVNDDGGDAVGLITRRDHRAMDLITLGAALLLVIGWIYEARAFPIKIPQQVDRFAIPSAAQPPTFATANMSTITYDPATQTLTGTVQASNKGGSPMSLKFVHVAGLTFVNPAAASVNEAQVQVQPSAPIAPGQTQQLTLTIKGNLLEQQRLIPIGNGQSNTVMAFVLEFANGSSENFVTVSQFLTPRFS